MLFSWILALTFCRAFFSPLVILLHATCYISDLIFVIIFFLLACSDGLDGYLARRYQLVSSLGAWLDHVSDKIFIAFFSTYWLFLDSNPLVIFVIMASQIRELIALSLRSAPFAVRGAKEHFGVVFFGKAKTACQSFALGLFFLSLAARQSAFFQNAAYVFLVMALFFSWVSLFQYVIGLKKDFYDLYQLSVIGLYPRNKEK